MNDFGDFDDDCTDDSHDDLGDEGHDFIDDDSIEDSFDDDSGSEDSFDDDMGIQDEPAGDHMCEDEISVGDAVFIAGTFMGWGYEEGLEEAERRRLEKEMDDDLDNRNQEDDIHDAN